MNEVPDLINTPLQWGDLPSKGKSNRFGGFNGATQTAEAVQGIMCPQVTPLKWGANETGPPISPAFVKWQVKHDASNKIFLPQ